MELNLFINFPKLCLWNCTIKFIFVSDAASSARRSKPVCRRLVRRPHWQRRFGLQIRWPVWLLAVSNARPPSYILVSVVDFQCVLLRHVSRVQILQEKVQVAKKNSQDTCKTSRSVVCSWCDVTGTQKCLMTSAECLQICRHWHSLWLI